MLEYHTLVNYFIGFGKSFDTKIFFPDIQCYTGPHIQTYLDLMAGIPQKPVRTSLLLTDCRSWARLMLYW